MAAGEKDSVSLYFTGAPRFKHKGEVVLFRKTDNAWEVVQRLTGEQVGPHFLIIVNTARIINQQQHYPSVADSERHFWVGLGISGWA